MKRMRLEVLVEDEQHGLWLRAADVAEATGHTTRRISTGIVLN